MLLTSVLLVISFAFKAEATGCGSGYYHIYPNQTSCECKPCPKGTYSNTDVALSCNQCPEGKTTQQEGSTSIDQCRIFCPKGYRVNDARDGCTICPNNTYSDTYDDATTCKYCAGNTNNPLTTKQVSAPGSTSSADCLCPPGYEFNREGFRFCWACRPGYYSTSFTRPNEKCVGCPIYQATPDFGSTSPTECQDIDTMCGAGSYFFHIFATCQLCPSGNVPRNITGTYSPDGGPCRGCPDGFTTIGLGAVSADNCTNCSDFTDDNPRNSSDSCERCSSGLYPYPHNSSDCIHCPRGTTDEDHRTCVCQPGYHYPSNNGHLGGCILCPQGTYKDHVGNEGCISCPEGTTTIADSAATSLDNCTSPA